MRMFVMAATVAALVATPALAVTNLIANGSFEAAGTTGTGAYNGWSKLNIPLDEPTSVIAYNSNASYPDGAFGLQIAPDNIIGSASPDGVGGFAAYFVGNSSVNETIFQDIFLTPGNYRVGFSYLLPSNGLANINIAQVKHHRAVVDGGQIKNIIDDHQQRAG